MSRDEWVFHVFFKVAVPSLAAFALFFAVQDLPPAYAALFRAGEMGTFTAMDEECGKTCSWRGDFVSDDRSMSRRNVLLASGTVDIDDKGDRVRARDTGNRAVVYPAGWSWDWLLVTGVSVISLVTLYLWGRWVLKWLRRRISGASPPAGLG